MRKTLTALLLLSLVVLPGCVFAVGEDWDDDGFHNSRMSKLEKRVSALEAKVEAMDR
ncbi:MAG: hypothetical protein ACYTCU_10285 [Planctomycetota bacterium]|jgi:hypothetical protein